MKAKEKAQRKLQQKAEHMKQQVDRLQVAQNLYTKAQELSAANEKAYKEKIEKEKDGQYYLTMLKKGTQADKISSLSIIIQRNP
jgi:ribosome biogenesis protein MAK21